MYEPLIHLLVAAPVLALGLVPARRFSGRVRGVIDSLSWLLFVALLFASFLFFCLSCN